MTIARPKVEVVNTSTADGTKEFVVITRGDGKKCTTHEVRGSSERAKIQNIVSDLLADRRMAEHLP